MRRFEPDLHRHRQHRQELVDQDQVLGREAAGLVGAPAGGVPLAVGELHRQRHVVGEALGTQIGIDGVLARPVVGRQVEPLPKAVRAFVERTDRAVEEARVVERCRAPAARAAARQVRLPQDPGTPELRVQGAQMHGRAGERHALRAQPLAQLAEQIVEERLADASRCTSQSRAELRRVRPAAVCTTAQPLRPFARARAAAATPRSAAWWSGAAVDASSCMTSTPTCGNWVTRLKKPSLDTRSATSGVVATTDAVRGTSHRMAISPTMSLRADVRHLHRPVVATARRCRRSRRARYRRHRPARPAGRSVRRA